MFDLHLLVHALEHGLLDSIKLLPFLFLTYLLMEFLEDRMNEKAKNSLMKAEKSGPVWGAVLGMLPQCGFSAAASNLYVGRIITMGTLISIYLSTSDEMLPIMISEAVPVVEIAKILAIKVVIGMVAGMGIDFVMQNLMHKELDEPDIHHFCEHEHCECGNGILKPAIRHTVQIWLFIDSIKIASPSIVIYDSNTYSYNKYKQYLNNNGDGKLFVTSSNLDKKTLKKLTLILKNKGIFKAKIINCHINSC